jgi:hypothetical protein
LYGKPEYIYFMPLDEKTRKELTEFANTLFANVSEDWMDQYVPGLGMSYRDYVEKHGEQGADTVRIHLLGIQANIHA